MAQLEAVSKGTGIPQGDDHSMKQKSVDSDEPMPAADDDDWIDDGDDDPNLESGDADPGDSMLAFVRNRATNILPLILGLFFKISGTSSRVVLMLSNAGVCVSGRTIERLKIRITEDEIQLAVSLITSGQVFFIIFDNINIFLQKAQQRISNTSNMINATNSAVVAIDGVEAFTEADLAEQLALRGRRAKAPPQDILPTPEDDEIVGRSFVFLIAEMIVSFTPGNRRWKDRKDIAAAVADMMPKDRPLPPTKTDAQPFRVLDVNEGSKKGVVSSSNERKNGAHCLGQGGPRSGGFLLVTGCPQTTSVLLAEIERTILMPRSASTSHMLMRTHYGHAVEDPASLAAHKGLLNRKWDVNKPNYAAAKSLIRHSLIARILHCVISLSGDPHPMIFKPSLSQYPPILQLRLLRKKRRLRAMIGWHIPSISFVTRYFSASLEKVVSFADPGQLIRVLKYWGLAFRGVGQHNYARECAEVLVRWRYELPDKLRLGLERSWFISRWDIRGRSIAADHYLEQLNYWVKRVFIASGSGVTIEYIMRKGSACVEAFRDITHLVANFFGDPDRARRSKEVKFNQDIEALDTEMQRRKFHVVSKERHFVPAPPKKPSDADRIGAGALGGRGDFDGVE
ncbi:hypothetical protein B0H14DRAFT_2600447 [Mycena olivaceomarginata]|nr:hypothetical protein B0H14DRAFT_2600447 [Mycena olivaceomarginata]